MQKGQSGGYSAHAPLAMPRAAPPNREPATSAGRPQTAPRAPGTERPEPPMEPEVQSIAPAKLNDRTFPVGAEVVPVLGYNPDRRYLFVLNIGANDVWISFGQGVATNRGIKLPANGFYEPLIAPTNEMFAISSAGSSLTLIEG